MRLKRYSKDKSVKAIARDRVGQPKPRRVIASHKDRDSKQEPKCQNFWHPPDCTCGSQDDGLDDW